MGREKLHELEGEWREEAAGEDDRVQRQHGGAGENKKQLQLWP